MGFDDKLDRYLKKPSRGSFYPRTEAARAKVTPWPKMSIYFANSPGAVSGFMGVGFE
jgi:hypothetical protein